MAKKIIGLVLINLYIFNGHGAALSPDEFAFFQAIEQNNIPEIKRLIRAGVNVNVINPKTIELPVNAHCSIQLSKGETPIAAYFRSDYSTNLEEIEMLLDAGADINSRGYLGFTPLQLYLCHLKANNELDNEIKIFEILNFLLERGANQDIVNDLGQSAIASAQDFYDSEKAYLNSESSQHANEFVIASSKRDIRVFEKIIKFLQEYKLRALLAGEELQQLKLPPEVAAIAQSYIAAGDWERNIKKKDQSENMEIKV